MAAYLLKLISTGEVVNIIEWDGVSSYTPPTGYELELITTSSADNIDYVSFT